MSTASRPANRCYGLFDETVRKRTLGGRTSSILRAHCGRSRPWRERLDAGDRRLDLRPAHVAFTKLGRPARRPAARQLDADIFDLRPRQRRVVGHALDLETPAHAQAAVDRHDPGCDVHDVAK